MNRATSGVRPAPAPAPKSRHTTLLIAAATALALIGIIAGVLAFVSRPEPAGSWPSAQSEIAAQFPSLLPAGPNAQGWGAAQCSSTSRDALSAISCTDSDGVEFRVWHTPAEPDRAVVAANVGSQPGVQRSWPEGPVSVSADSVTDGWVITNFNDATRAPYTIVAMWPGHSGEQVLDKWWRNAPFGSAGLSG